MRGRMSPHAIRGNQALPLAGIHGHDGGMQGPITERFRHAPHLVRPGWLIAAGLVGFVGTAQTLWPFAPAGLRARVGVVIPQLTWEQWGLIVCLIMIAGMFEGSFRHAREQKRQSDELEGKLEAIGIERALTFVEIKLENQGNNGNGLNFATGIYIVFRNHSQRMIRYRFVDVEIAAEEILDKTPDGFIHQGETLHHYVSLMPSRMWSEGIKLILSFDIKCDSEPPTQERTMGRTLTYEHFPPRDAKTTVHQAREAPNHQFEDYLLPSPQGTEQETPR